MNKTNLNDRLASLYYNPKESSSFSSIEKLYRAAKKQLWKDVTREKVKKWLNAQETYSLHKTKRYRFPRTKIITYGIRYLMATDLAQFDSLAQYNSNVRYILFLVDAFTKQLYLYPLKKKQGKLTAEALDYLFTEKGAPLFLTSDLGSEFFNYDVEAVLKNITFYNILLETM